MSWQDNAECKGLTDLMFPGRGDNEGHRKAKHARDASMAGVIGGGGGAGAARRRRHGRHADLGGANLRGATGRGDWDDLVAQGAIR